jgi:glycosyltransferase involved in cell wall biosynthesis
MRRPYLDLQTVQSRGFSERGIPRFATGLSLGLIRAGVSVAGFGLNPNHPFPKHLPRDLAESPHLTWNTAATLRRVRAEGPLLYHVMSPFERPVVTASALPGHVLGSDIPIACTVYDLVPDMTGALAPGSRDERFHLIRNRLLARADLLLALSEQTRRDVIGHLGVDPDRVAVVGASTSDSFRLPFPDEEPRALIEQSLPRIKRPFLLTVAAWLPHKNTEFLVDTFARLPDELRRSLQLVVACTLPADRLIGWEKRTVEAGLTPHEDVVFTGFVPDAVLRALYQETELFVYPSRYEGFGLPVLEAARCGSPAITSNASSLPEVLEWPPATFDPGDPDDLVDLIDRALHDTAFRSGLLEAGAAAAKRHTWDGVVRRTLDAYERIEPPRSGRRPRRRRLRVAIVGPFPPVRSGVARYNLEIAASLAERCDLDCFVDACDWVHDDILHELPTRRVQAVGPRRPRGSRARWFPARALGRTLDPARYDAIIYAIGNSWFHHDTLSIARRYPGIVWLHDVDLVGLYITYAHRLLDTDPPAAVVLFRDVLARYGPRAHDFPVTLTDRRWAMYEPYRRAGLRLSLELACDSRMSIVTSHLARKLLELDAGPGAHLAPIEVLPLAVPKGRVPPRSTETVPPLVVTLGRQEDAKQPEVLIDALGILNRTQPVRLAIAGQIRPDLSSRLRRRIDTAGLNGMVEVMGFVSDREYRDLINRSTCAVQLRRNSTGEGSAAVGDALAAGVPVITNIPSSSEFPDGTLERVPDSAGSDAIAREIQQLIDDPQRRRRLSDGALRYAQSWSFDDVATRLLELVLEDIRHTAAAPQAVTA